MTIGDIIDNWIDRQKYDLRDTGNFTKETLRGNDENIGRRAFGKSVVTLLAGGGAGGYAVNEHLEGDQSQQPTDSQDGSNDGQNGGTNGRNNGGDVGNNDGGSDSVDDVDPEVESIYEVLDDPGDTDIEIMEDWLGDAYDRGHGVDNVVMGYSDSRDQDYLGFNDNSNTELPLWLTESNGYSNSEVDTLREYDEKGKLSEVLRPAAE